MVYNWQKTLWNYTIDHWGLVYYIIINAAELDCSIVSHWLSRRPAARRAADFGIIEKPTCSHQSPTRLLWGDIGISSAHYRVPIASIHQWPPIGCLLLRLKTTLRLLWVRFLQSFMKWEPNNRHKTLCGGISCTLLIKMSNRINYYNT